MRYLILILFPFSLFAQFDCVEREKGIATNIQNIDSEVVSTNSGRYRAFPTVTKCANGTFITVFYDGNTHAAEGEIAMATSTDGETWSATTTIEGTGNNWRTPNVTTLPNGDLLLYYWNRIDVNPTALGTFIRCRRSSDCGATWSAPQDLPAVWTESNRNEKPVVTSEGTILLPIAGYNTGQTLSNQVGGVYRSTDGGLTYTFVPYTDQSGILTEANLLVLGNQICVYNRRNDTGRLLKAVSLDDGLTWSNWSDVSPSDYLNTRPDFIYHEGCLFLAYRSNPDQGITFAFSDNLGSTWRELGQLAPLPLSGTGRLSVYSDFTLFDDNILLLVFGWERDNNVSRIFSTKIDLIIPRQSKGKNKTLPPCFRGTKM